MTDQEMRNFGRRLTALDHVLASTQAAFEAVLSTPSASTRPDPADPVDQVELSDSDRAESVRLMRVNHVGEVCAQALYEGQALMARDDEIRASLLRAAEEERDHLQWCAKRLRQLDGRVSLLNPLWYAGSFAMGAVAGLAGDRWSLGFLKETEEQVEAHLESHLDRLPVADKKSRAVVAQMKEDEKAHAQSAAKAGGSELPSPIPTLMRAAARVMTATARWV